MTTRTRSRRQPAQVTQAARATRARVRVAMFTDRSRWRRRITLAAGVLGAAGAVALVVWVFWFSTLLAVSSVRVAGVTGAAAQEALVAADVPVGLPLARLDDAQAAADVRGLAWVDSVEIRRGWPHEVVVAVTPRVPLARLNSGEFLAADGVSFVLPSGAGPVLDPAIALPTVSAKGDARVEAMKVLASLSPDLALRVKELSGQTRDSIDLLLRGGARVHWGSADEPAEKVQVLRSLLAHRADVYDVTSPELPTTWRRG